MLLRDACSIVPHIEAMIGLAVCRIDDPTITDIDLLAVLAIFKGVLDQILEHLHQFIAITGNPEIVIQLIGFDCDIQILRQRAEAVDDVTHDFGEIDALCPATHARAFRFSTMTIDPKPAATCARIDQA